ncbi:MAG: cellulase family glycosylhydrolase [Opitutaceae bacterium]|nr:cellulase family glycosylhydrolase [Opitutaceae bacterium]
MRQQGSAGAASRHQLARRAVPEFTSRAIRTLAGDWRVTVLRPALYVTSFYGNRSLEQQVDRYVDACEENGIYCIIDWHSVTSCGSPRWSCGGRSLRPPDRALLSEWGLLRRRGPPAGQAVARFPRGTGSAGATVPVRRQRARPLQAGHRQRRQLEDSA